MSAVKQKPETRDQGVQTRLYVRSQLPFRSGHPLKVLCNHTSQTVISCDPRLSDHNIQALLSFVPQHEIRRDSLRQYDLPRAHIRFKPTRVAVFDQDDVLAVDPIAHANCNVTKGVLRKTPSVITDLEHYREHFNHYYRNMSSNEKTVENEVQTSITVKPHVLDNEQTAAVGETLSAQTSLQFRPTENPNSVQNDLISVLDHFAQFASLIVPTKYKGENQQQARVSVTSASKKPAGYCVCKQTSTYSKVDSHDSVMEKYESFDIRPEKRVVWADDSLNQFIDELLSETICNATDSDSTFDTTMSNILNKCVLNIENRLIRILDLCEKFELNLNYIPPTAIQPRVGPSQPQSPPVVCEIPGDCTFIKPAQDIPCECCTLNAGGAAVPVLGEPVPAKSDDVICIVQKQSCASSKSNVREHSQPVSSNEAVVAESGPLVRFSIEPGNARSGATMTYPTGKTASAACQCPACSHPCIFEILVTCPQEAANNRNTQSQNLHLGTPPISTTMPSTCVVVCAPRKMRTSDDNIPDTMTSQDIGLMFEQDNDYAEPYLSCMNDPSLVYVPEPTSKEIASTRKRIKLVQEPCTTGIEIPWELLTFDEYYNEDEDGHVCQCTIHAGVDCTVYKKDQDHIKYIKTEEPGSRPLTDKAAEPSEVTPLSQETPDDHANITEVMAPRSKDYIGSEQNIDRGYQPEFEYDKYIEGTDRPLLLASTDEVVGSIVEQRCREKQQSEKSNDLVFRVNLRPNESYMNCMWKQFPDEDERCGSETEIPWELITLPVNPKIRKIQNSTKLHKPTSTAVGETPSKAGVDLLISFTEFCSNIFRVENGAMSQQTVSHISTISDFRFLAKRTEKICEITMQYKDRPPVILTNTPQIVDCGSSKFLVTGQAMQNALSTVSVEFKPFHEEKLSNIVTYHSDFVVRPNETKSMGANMCASGPSTSKGQPPFHSMPDIPSRGSIKHASYRPRTTNCDASCKGMTPSAGPCGSTKDPIVAALDICQQEMQPLREALANLKRRLRELNMPELMHTCFGAPQTLHGELGPTPRERTIKHRVAINGGQYAATVTRMRPLFLHNDHLGGYPPLFSPGQCYYPPYTHLPYGHPLCYGTGYWQPQHHPNFAYMHHYDSGSHRNKRSKRKHRCERSETSESECTPDVTSTEISSSAVNKKSAMCTNAERRSSNGKTDADNTEPKIKTVYKTKIPVLRKCTKCQKLKREKVVTVAPDPPQEIEFSSESRFEESEFEIPSQSKSDKNVDLRNEPSHQTCNSSLANCQPTCHSSQEDNPPACLESRKHSQPTYNSSRECNQPTHNRSRESTQPTYNSSRETGHLVCNSSIENCQPTCHSSHEDMQPAFFESRKHSQPTYRSRESNQPTKDCSLESSQPTYNSSRKPSHHSFHEDSKPAYLGSHKHSQPTNKSSREHSQASNNRSRESSQPVDNSSLENSQPNSSHEDSQPTCLASRKHNQPTYNSSRKPIQSAFISSRDHSQPTNISSHPPSQSTDNSSLPQFQPNCHTHERSQPTCLSSRAYQPTSCNSRRYFPPTYNSSHKDSQCNQPNCNSSRGCCQPTCNMSQEEERTDNIQTHLKPREIKEDISDEAVIITGKFKIDRQTDEI